ncbi:Wadjet anti-phage system protein JetD domain-containing protein [Nocardioides nanhaiensis]|uniref:DUF3322 and DUF2220 domain-containing protein n=1 Tax=Nocardioides nanhaiensis TaxID=1476871 RepID=A0ABP8X0H0_9ACTN
MLSPEEARAQVRRRLEARWHRLLTKAEPWSPQVPLGSSGLRGRTLAAQWPQVHAWALRWVDAERALPPGVRLVRREDVRVHGTVQPLPALLEVADLDAAAALAGEEWPARLRAAQARLALLRAQLPALRDRPCEPADLASLLRALERRDDLHVARLLRAAHWLTLHPTSGISARQVPVEGLGTKWLELHAGDLRRLLGREELGLVHTRPRRVHLTYLDPGHRAAGRRRHDVVTEGDVETLAYRPRVVVVCENRENAQGFAPVPGGVAVEGDGNGPGLLADLAWVREARPLWYWGDLDARGFEILHGYRAAGLPARSLLMDLATFERWQHLGVSHDERGAEIRPRTARDLPLLETPERGLYRGLCSPDWNRPRRLEQEYVQVAEAAALVLSSLDALEQ